MAPSTSTAVQPPAPTRPRLQSVNRDFSDLNEQIRQVARIIRLPDDWIDTKGKETRSITLQHVVRARAEWVLRWILDKFKDETDAGKEARASATAWQMLECIIHILPVSRSAQHLRDAGLTSILERTLLENFDKDLDGPTTTSNGDLHMRDASESSETIHEESQPSRKRKRGTIEASPSKRTAVANIDLAILFHVVQDVLRSITEVAGANKKTNDSTQAELMKMVLRTESAQASRILKFWLIAVQKFLARPPSSNESQSQENLLELSTVFHIWDLRVIDVDDNTSASSEDFANECLVPTLQLIEAVRITRASNIAQACTKSLDAAIQSLDKLLTRHLLIPSRAAFFAEAHAQTDKTDTTRPEAASLSLGLNPLRAMLLQAAQIEDAGEAVPAHLSSLSKTVPYLLDLAIRASPSKTPKARLAERPWIQAVFICLTECVGCSLKAPPEFVTSKTAVVALQSALEVLHSHSTTMSPAILKDVFWYHCGVKHPQTSAREVHWTLIAALIDLDASTFVAESRSSSNTSKEQHVDLVEFLFELISHTEFHGPGFADHERATRDETGAGEVHAESKTSRGLILDGIIVPVMSAFSRNRNLLGFIRKWDDQLVKSYKSDNRKALKEKSDPIWEDRVLTTALMGLFEQSLTQGQIAKLIEEHANRMDDLRSAIENQVNEGAKIRKLAAYKKASSSAVIIPALLQSIQSDDTLAALRTQLHLLFAAYLTRVRDDRYSAFTRVAFSWITLCQLMAKLWPVEMHASLKLQQMLLHPLMEQATKVISAGRKDSDGRRVDSPTRAAAILFLLGACNRLQSIPGSEEQVENGLRKVVKSLSANQLEEEEYIKVVEIFCTDFIQLLNHQKVEASRRSLVTILARIATFEDNLGDHISSSLSQAIFEQGNRNLHNAYSSALSESLHQDGESRLHEVATEAILNMQPSAMSRERRGAILDQLTTLLCTGTPNAVGALAVVSQLMEAPNASANISTNGSVLFDIATSLQKPDISSHISLQQLQRVSQQTLGHIIPNQSQAQSRIFLGEFQKKLESMTHRSKKVSPTALAVLRATILEQKSAQLLGVKQYVSLLKQCLTDDGSDADDVAPLEHVLDAFIEMFPTLLVDATLFKATATWLRTWIKDNADLDSYITSTTPVSVEVAEYVARLHKLVAKYRLYPDLKWLIALTLKILRESVADEIKRSALSAVTEALVALETVDKLALVPVLTNVEDPLGRPASYRVLHSLVSTLSDKVSQDAMVKKQQLALLPRISSMLADASDDASFNALIDSVDTLLNNKVSLTSQHSIECVLSVLVKLTSRTSPALSPSNASHIFTRVCNTSRLILVVHRNKLGGRSHLLIPLLQSLLFCLFKPTSARSGALPAWLRSNTSTDPIRLTPLNASHYTRLLSTLCNPPQSSISKSHQHSRKSKDLNDPIKVARERTSHFLYPLLASFCRFQLAGRLDPAVRAKLMPGIWEVVGTASLHKEELDAMFAGLGRSEKDVWRGVWGEWQSVHGRKERFVGEDA